MFVDPHPPTSNNGGHATNNAMKCNELENLINNENSTLRSKPTKTILRDYEDDNLLKAFPLQFPFGVGSYPVDVPVSSFYEYLNDLYEYSNNFNFNFNGFIGMNTIISGWTEPPTPTRPRPLRTC